MRNLKRVLSLTLASVMLMGMMVVGSNAAAGYDDVAETDNVEAIEVLQTIEVMVGDERGFGPERPVNRAEMAVVMGKLLNLDYNYYSATCPFNDVYDWARGWVGACAANGIVSGRGDGVYDPGSTVTAVEAASMLMRALGYFKYQSDYADGFEVATVRQGTTIGIFKGVGSSATEAMTRNQVAQMVLNALKSGMVQPDGNTLNYFDSNGNVIATGGKINYVYVTSDEAYATAIRNVNATSMGSFNTNPIVELGEQLYSGNLKLYGEGSSIRDREWDVFGRPARRWEYKGQDIGTYVKKELLKQEYSAKVTGQTLYELLGKSVVDNYAFQIVIDGVDTTDNNAASILRGASFDKNDLYRTNKDAVGRTGKGVQTLVYVDTDFDKSEDYHVYISIINTYLAKANEDYDTRDDDVSLRVWHLDYDGTIASPIFAKSNGDKPYEDYTSTDNDYTDVKAKGEDFDLVKDVKEDELYMVQVADGEIQTIMAPEILSAVTVDAFKLNDHVTTGGETYEYASTARYDVEAIENYTDGSGTINLKDLTYNVILDQYGYLIGLELNENNDQYVFLTGLEQGASNLYAKQVDGNIIHMDGTMETVKIDMTKSRCGQPGHTGDGLLAHNVNDAGNGYVKKNLSQLNTWCTYTVDTNGVYTLTMVPVSTTENKTTTGANAIKKAQYAQDVAVDNDGASEQENNKDTKSINTKRVSLKASNGNEYVYGNDKTVYITVSLENIAVDDSYITDQRYIVDDVDSVTTGVKNVDLKAIELGEKDENNFYYPDAEIYTLYDNKGAVIAAVVIGDDEGTTSTYAYIHTSKLEEEIYNGNSSSRAAGDGKWTWTRYAIVNGVKTLLKEVSDKPEYLKAMSQGEWYEIKYDSDGNVRKATVVKPDNNNVGAAGDVYKWIAEVVDVEGSVNEYDNVVLLDVTTVTGLVFKNGTLWTNTEQTKGFSVHPDVKTVLAVAGKSGGSFNQSNRTFSGSAFNDTFDGYTGYNGLEQALREMNAEKSDNFTKTSVQIGAILENGRATTIVINDMNPAPDNRPGGGGSSQTSSVTADSGAKDLVKDVTGSASVNSRGIGSWTVSVTAPEWVTDDATAKVTYELYVNGVFDGTYTDKNATKSNGVYTVSDSDYGFDANDKLTVKVTNVKWSKVHVKVEGADRVESPTPADALTAETATAGDIKFTVDTTKYTPESVAAAKYTVSGLTTTPTEKTGVGSQQTISGVKALGTGYVTVNVTGLVAVTPPEPATEYKITVRSGVKDTLEFAVVDSVPSFSGIPADDKWSGTVTAAEGKIVLIRSAVDGVELSTSAGGVVVAYDDLSGALSGGNAVANISGTTVWQFKMPAKDVSITSTANNTVNGVKYFIANDWSVVNIKTDKAASSLGTDAKKFEFAVKYLKAQGENAEIVENRDGTTGGMTIDGKNIDISSLSIGDDLIWATVGGETIVSSNGTDKNVDDFLGLAGVTNNNEHLYVKVGNAGKASNDGSTAITDGAVIDTNDGKGYVKLNGTAVAATATLSGSAVSTGSFTNVDVALKPITAAEGFTDNGDTYVKVGATLTVTLNPQKTGTTGDKATTAKITANNTTVTGPYGSAAVVTGIPASTEWAKDAEDLVTLTFQLTNPTGGATGSITVELDDAGS